MSLKEELEEIKEIPETAVDYNNEQELSSWLPHRKGQEVSCKLWQILPCNFRFYFGGLLMMGPGKPYWLYLVFLLFGVTSSFVIFDGIPFYNRWPDAILCSFLVFLSAVSFYNLIKIIFTDPGYMLPHWFSNQWLWLKKDITPREIHNEFGYTSYCNICKIFQFPDTFHCHDCHACIDGGDHHCDILGTCVGRRNYRSFYIFTLSTSVALLVGLIVSVVHFIENWIFYGIVDALGKGVTLYLILSTLVLPPFGLLVIIRIPYVHTKMTYEGRTLNQEYYCLSEYWELERLSKWKKCLQLLHNLNERVIKTPPPSQISFQDLQSFVRMRAVPRTLVVNEHHHTLQNQYAIPKVRLVTYTIFSQKIFHSCRMNIIHRDMDLYQDYVFMVNASQTVQKQITYKLQSISKPSPILDIIKETNELKFKLARLVYLLDKREKWKIKFPHRHFKVAPEPSWSEISAKVNKMLASKAEGGKEKSSQRLTNQQSNRSIESV